MRIMSFNVLCGGPEPLNWENRTSYVVETIRLADPDSFGVQEAHIGWMKVLTEALPEYDYVGVGRDDGKEKGEFSAVFYKKDKFEVSCPGTFWLSETPDKPGKGWDAACVRICSYVLLKEKETGIEYVHFNTHLDHRGEVAMQKGAELVTIKANELFPGRTAVFTGDFNVTPDSAPCKAVLDGGFRDSRYIAKKADLSNTFHAYNTDDVGRDIIDYVFVRGDITVEEFVVMKNKVNGVYPSDHWAVYADVTIGKGE